eukprot:COSAG01_NODE_1715_length_9405_cov_5.798517_9_plen_111_part_00
MHGASTAVALCTKLELHPPCPLTQWFVTDKLILLLLLLLLTQPIRRWLSSQSRAGAAGQVAGCSPQLPQQRMLRGALGIGVATILLQTTHVLSTRPRLPVHLSNPPALSY